MKESVLTAIGWIKSNFENLGISNDLLTLPNQDPSNFFDSVDIHIHFPSAAIPKDGPSAGVTITTALVSLLTNRKVNSNVAMTGEISLKGIVLPVGGIKEKTIAAHTAGIRTVILPKRNKKDLVDIPEEVKKDINFVFASHVSEVLECALEKKEDPTPENQLEDARNRMNNINRLSKL
eukprot:TRINITY_DN7865_c0_g1_i1.p1 TRINITY_DN7865_c0_g1~~TRINITY_DN7865_c0_g1_i1.p1  ORF type:complete len:178 (-),score=56.17 TRINITY_DN7865_c0_g1_i1:33-566(-)